MKIFVFTVVLTLFLCGCGIKEEPKHTENPPERQEKAVPEEPPKPPAPKETRLSSFKTEIHDSSENRLHNISLAIKSINGVTLAPGEVFSFNNTVGERSQARGYKKAKVLLKGEYVEDFGGGVCQVSTTIYNAATIAGLQIIEHHTHNKPASYVPEGKDAAVNYPDLDLKIKNNTDGNIRIEVSKGQSEIYANIVHIK